MFMDSLNKAHPEELGSTVEVQPIVAGPAANADDYCCRAMRARSRRRERRMGGAAQTGSIGWVVRTW